MFLMISAIFCKNFEKLLKILVSQVWRCYKPLNQKLLADSKKSYDLGQKITENLSFNGYLNQIIDYPSNGYFIFCLNEWRHSSKSHH